MGDLVPYRQSNLLFVVFFNTLDKETALEYLSQCFGQFFLML